MAVTQVNPNAGRQQNSGNDLMAALNSINQRRHQVEEQQRAMEYEFINNYAATHGGFAGIAAMPGGEEMLSHYATNVMGYSPETVPDLVQAVQQGYNPDEALYQINRKLMFTNEQRSQQQQQQGQQQSQGQQGPTVNMSDVGMDVIDPYTKEIDVRQESPQVSATRQFGPRAEGQPSQTTGMLPGEVQEKQTEQFNKGQRREEAYEAKFRNMSDFEVSVPEDQIDTMTSDILRETALFRGSVPYYDRQTAVNKLGEEEGKNAPVMNERQQNAYNQVKAYVAAKNARTPKDFFTGLKGVFNTVNKKNKYTGTGGDKPAFKQIEQRAAKSFNALPNIKDYGQLTVAEAQQYRDVVDNMWTNNPQRAAETFRQALGVKKDVSDIKYKDSMTELMKAQAAMQKMNYALGQQKLNNPEVAEAGAAMDLVMTFMKNPELGEIDEFKPAAEAAAALLFKIWGENLDTTKQITTGLRGASLWRAFNPFNAPSNAGVNINVGSAGTGGQQFGNVDNWVQQRQ